MQAGPLIPIMEQYNVDVYDAGHVHSYEVTWPQKGGKTTATSYDKPQGIVYITEGNGGEAGLVQLFLGAHKNHCLRDEPRLACSPPTEGTMFSDTRANASN